MLLKPGCVGRKIMYSSVWKILKSIGKENYVQSCRKMIHHPPPVVTEVRHIHYPLCWGLVLFPLWWISTAWPISLGKSLNAAAAAHQNNNEKFICEGFQTFKIMEAATANNKIYSPFWEGCTKALKITSWYYMQIHMFSVCLSFETLPFIEGEHLAIFRGMVTDNVKRNH